MSILDIALDASQINNYMNCPLNGNELGLVGYWDFEEVVVILLMTRHLMVIMESLMGQFTVLVAYLIV